MIPVTSLACSTSELPLFLNRLHGGDENAPFGILLCGGIVWFLHRSLPRFLGRLHLRMTLLVFSSWEDSCTERKRERERERERETAQGSSCFKGFAEICNRSSVHLLRFTMRRSKICCILPHHPSQSLFEKMHTVTLSLLELRKKLSPALKTWSGLYYHILLPLLHFLIDV